jgi:hypothetical protein
LEKETAFVNDIISKVNGNEKLVGIGSVIVIASFILGIVTFRFVGFLSLPCAVISLVVLFLKYSPDSKVEWPIPVPLILVILGGIATFSAAWGLFWSLIGGLFSLIGFDVVWALIGVVLSAAILLGSAMMLFGGYKEYQVKTA